MTATTTTRWVIAQPMLLLVVLAVHLPPCKTLPGKACSISGGCSCQCWSACGQFGMRWCGLSCLQLSSKVPPCLCSIPPPWHLNKWLWLVTGLSLLWTRTGSALKYLPLGCIASSLWYSQANSQLECTCVPWSQAKFGSRCICNHGWLLPSAGPDFMRVCWSCKHPPSWTDWPSPFSQWAEPYTCSSSVLGRWSPSVSDLGRMANLRTRRQARLELVELKLQVLA